MKNILFISFLLLSTSVKSQGVYDICLLKQLNDINIINCFLVKYNGYEFIGDYGKDENGWKIYKFSKGKNFLEIGINHCVKDSVINYLTDIKFYLNNKNEYLQFVESLKVNKFEMNKAGKNKNGDQYEIWNGTATLNDQLTSIIIEEKGKIFCISIL